MDQLDHYDFCKKNFKPLKFGTSGLRGIDEDLTDMQIYISTKGFLKFILSNKINTKKDNIVAVAGDFRPSTSRILIAVCCAICDMGFKAEYLGKIPTPALSYYGFENKIPSLIVTGSHNPYGQNGVKYNKKDGEVLKHDEKDILEKVEETREEEYKKSFKESMFDDKGYFKDISELTEDQHRSYIYSKEILKNVNKEAEEMFIKRYSDAFGKVLEGEKIVFFQQTAVGRELIPRIFESLGCKVIREGFVDERNRFVPVDTEDMKEEILEEMHKYMVDNHCDVCLTTDGDSDRPALVYVDKFGQKSFLKGDKLNVLTALLIKPDFFSFPVSFNNRAVELLKKNNIEVRLTKVGSPYVIHAMIERSNNGRLKDLRLFACEVNGGALLGTDIDFSNEFKGKLKSLPTRDAVLPLLSALILSKKENKKIRELVEDIFSDEYESYSHAGLVENLPGVSVTEGCEEYTADIGKKIIQNLSPMHEEIMHVHFEGEIELKDYYEEKIQVENEVAIKDHLVSVRETLHFYVRDILGTEDVTINKITYIDGVRIYLSNNEIIHFRPSGNSAQFRIYIESNDEKRIMKLVEKSVSPGDGVLVRMINDFISGKMNL